MLRRSFLEEDQAGPPQETRDTTEGAFNVLARFSTAASRGGGSPISRWRRSAIRIAASNTSRKLRETARLKALQRTPYPLVLARIKLLLDRLTVFKEHVTQSAMTHGSVLQSSKGTRRRSSVIPSNGMRVDVGMDGGVASRVAAAAAAAAAADNGEDEGTDDDQLVSSAIRSWDLRRVGGYMPSGPMDNLYGDQGHPSRRSSKMARESRSPTGFSEDELDDVSGGARLRKSNSPSLRRSPSPTRSVMTGATSGVLGSVASGMGRSVFGAGGGGEVGGTEAESLMDQYDNMALDDPSSGNKMSLDKLLEELSTTMSYVSEFLRKVPEETRMEACFAAKMENFKKDQTVYNIGDPPERFHLILTGVVEIWTHPPVNKREKTLIATLKKGQSFGEMAILNDEPRAEVATPTSNCTFLTFHRTDLLSCFGPFFRERLLVADKFFHSRVVVFQAVPKKDTLKVISHMMQSIFPAGKEWEPVADQQIYFIKSGTATLEALDRRCATTPAVPSPTSGHGATRGGSGGPLAAGHTAGLAAIGGGGHSAAGGGGAAGDGHSGAIVGDIGEDDEEVAVENEILAAITIVDGRAIGTLGHEDELRRMRRAAIPKKTVAVLEPGSYFGGGARVLGEGELQSCMKVTSNTEITVYHMHIDQYFKCASHDLVRALRDDTAFKMTYYFGRLGTIGQDVVIGHPDSSLASHRMGITIGEDEESPLAPIRGTGGLGHRKKRGGKKAGGHSTEVDKVIAFMREQEADLDNPGSKNLELYKSGTPVERYYRNPLLSGTARGNALPNIIGGLYGEGLAPLADKVDALAAKAARRLEMYHGDKRAVQRMMSIMAPPSPTGQGFTGPGGMPTRGNNSSIRYPNGGVPGTSTSIAVSSGTAAAAVAAVASTSTAAVASSGIRTGLPSRLGSMRPPALALDPAAVPAGSPADLRRNSGQVSSPAGAATAAVNALRPRSSPNNIGGGGGGGTGGMQGSLLGVRVSAPGEDGVEAAVAAAGGGGGGGGGGGEEANNAMLRRSGALTAASYIWQRMRDVGGRAPPQIRQCLTYDEITHVKAEAKRSMSYGNSASAMTGGTGTGVGGG